MTVTELIAELQKLDGARLVILQKDAEGNGFSPLAGFWEGAYLPYSTWGGEAGLEFLTAKDKANGYGEEDVVDDGQKAVILVPVN